MPNSEMVSVRYMVDDVEEAIVFYTNMLGFEVLTSAPPAFADIKRGNLRLLLAGPKSDATARRRRDVPQRGPDRTRRQAIPARGPVGQRRRAVPTGSSLIRESSGWLSSALCRPSW